MSSLPRIAIIGRPNVGKSSLLNMLAKYRVSIVDPTPGVTRDRISVYLDLECPPDLMPREPRRRKRTKRKSDPPPPAKTVEVIDTGGYGVYTGEEDDVDSKTLTKDIEFQIAQAVNSADVILFIIDAQAGLAPLDYTVAELLRKSGVEDRVKLIANKVDGESWEPHGYEAAALGMGEPFFVSATSQFNRRSFLAMLYEAVPDVGRTPNAEMKMAVIGKRNAGKSTFINALVGEERVIVSEIPGTTRDSVDVRLEINDRSLIAIDTAGLRKRKSVQDDVEYYASHRALRSIRRADVILLMVDATSDISQVDKKITQEIQDLFKPCVIVVNKWDLVEGKLDQKGNPITPEHYLDYLTQELRGLDYAPCVFISAKNNDHVLDAVALAFNLYEQAGHRVGTGALNTTMENILKKRGPTSKLGRQAKILYVSQVAVHPPTIVMVVNRSEMFEGPYERYLMNRLREELPYSEVPIRLIFRSRKRVSLQALKEGAHRHHDEDDAGDYDDQSDNGIDLESAVTSDQADEAPTPVEDDPQATT